jgi:hypothetical protein
MHVTVIRAPPRAFGRLVKATNGSSALACRPSRAAAEQVSWEPQVSVDLIALKDLRRMEPLNGESCTAF